MCLLGEGHLLIEDVPGSARRAWPRRSPGRSTARGSGSSSPPTCSRPTSSASRDLPALDGAVPLPARAALRQHRARRRDQPGVAEDPVGAARGDGGAQVTVDGQPHVLDAAVHGHRHPEPGRPGGHLPPAREPARPVPAADLASATRPRAEMSILDDRVRRRLSNRTGGLERRGAQDDGAVQLGLRRRCCSRPTSSISPRRAVATRPSGSACRPGHPQLTGASR